MGTDREFETTLAIISGNPEDIASQISTMSEIADYWLLPQDTEAIHDIYFDTVGHELQHQKLALRIRAVGEKYLCTLKGDSQTTGWGGEDRMEIEAPWSKEALARIVEELNARGIMVQSEVQDFDPEHPRDVMESLGLEVIQDRKTERRVRNVVPKSGSNSPILAELAIDAVVYTFNSQHIRHHEVEIEAKAKRVHAAIEIMVEQLRKKYGPTLRKWPYGKLPTGKAIEKLWKEGSLEGSLDANNNLKPAAYDKIEGFLKSSDT